MITNNNLWSLGTTPNKSLESFGPSIPNHPPGGRTTIQKPESFWSKDRRFSPLPQLQIRAIRAIRGQIFPCIKTPKILLILSKTFPNSAKSFRKRGSTKTNDKKQKQKKDRTI